MALRFLARDGDRVAHVVGERNGLAMQHVRGAVVGGEDEATGSLAGFEAAGD